MGPVIMVPTDVARRIAAETHLVEVDQVLPDAVDGFDVQVGSPPGDIMLLTETPANGYEELVALIADHMSSAQEPMALIVTDKSGDPHALGTTEVSSQVVREHLKLAYYGAPSDRRPLFPGEGG